jgi:hypothetical protein
MTGSTAGRPHLACYGIKRRDIRGQLRERSDANSGDPIRLGIVLRMMPHGPRRISAVLIPVYDAGRMSLSRRSPT